MAEDIKPVPFGDDGRRGGVRSPMSATGDAETALRRENERLLVLIAGLERRLGAVSQSSIVDSDVSQPSQTEAEEALRQSELRCRSLLETAVDGILLLDVTGFVECNRSAATHVRAR